MRRQFFTPQSLMADCRIIAITDRCVQEGHKEDSKNYIRTETYLFLTSSRSRVKVLDLVNTGIRCSIRQLLEYGYFDADPHPGNLLATPDGKLAFLDFGVMIETPKEARNFFDDALNSTVSNLNLKTIVDGHGVVLYEYPLGEFRFMV
nr:hypothetical protein [Tanacetum cinerariifolium]